MANKKALIGMSGGVDSSVSAYLMLRRGFDCIGATMRLYTGREDGTCCSEAWHFEWASRFMCSISLRILSKRSWPRSSAAIRAV